MKRPIRLRLPFTFAVWGEDPRIRSEGVRVQDNSFFTIPNVIFPGSKRANKNSPVLFMDRFFRKYSACNIAPYLRGFQAVMAGHSFQRDWRILCIRNERQACASPQLQRRLAIELLQEKLDGQLKNLKGLETEKLTVGAKQAVKRGMDQFRGIQGGLLRCQNPEQMIEVEAQAGRACRGAFDAVPLKWKITATKTIPEHWLTIGSKISPKSDNGRFAVTPFHACLNYLYGCLESRIKRYCIAYRLDMDFPVLHSYARTNRSGLIYDIMEPVRPSVDRLLYRFMSKTTLKISDFFETRQGVCKVMPELTSKIIPLVKSLDPDINKIVKEFAGNFKTRLVKALPESVSKVAEPLEILSPGNLSDTNAQTVKEAEIATIPSGRALKKPKSKTNHARIKSPSACWPKNFIGSATKTKT
jgi:CRISPR/Cas system-associated endonuclease Cas1